MSRTLRKRWVWDEASDDSRLVKARENTCKPRCGCKAWTLIDVHLGRRRQRYNARAQIIEQLDAQ